MLTCVTPSAWCVMLNMSQAHVCMWQRRASPVSQAGFSWPLSQGAAVSAMLHSLKVKHSGRQGANAPRMPQAGSRRPAAAPRAAPARLLRRQRGRCACARPLAPRLPAAPPRRGPPPRRRRPGHCPAACCPAASGCRGSGRRARALHRTRRRRAGRAAALGGRRAGGGGGLRAALRQRRAARAPGG